ncbi:MAG: BspA family leucine-rich repeat surface protein [bacterium]|nr:BspA family leucine-rich repeat surface protein [bacterium]
MRSFIFALLFVLIASFVSAECRRIIARKNAGGAVETSFIFTIDTTGTDKTFKIPVTGPDSNYDCNVDWGDGNDDDITTTADAAWDHTYLAEQVYTITISGTFKKLYFNNGGDVLMLRTVTNLGVVGWTGCNAMFEGAKNITSVVVGNTDTSGCTSMTEMFDDLESATTLNVAGLDTSNVTNMRYMFFDVDDLVTLDVSGFDVSSVTNFNQMFDGMTNVTALDVSGWNTGSAVDMLQVFYLTNALTSLDVSGWDVADVDDFSATFAGMAVTSLDVSNFTTTAALTMWGMFLNSNDITSLDVSGFDMNGVTNVDSMFKGMSGLTSSLVISDWDVTTLTTDPSSFMNGISAAGFSTAEYDAALIAWEGQAVNNNLDWDFGSNVCYTTGGAAETARTALINDHNWTFDDNGGCP